MHTWPQAPQLLGSIASRFGSTSSIRPSQSLSTPSQVSTPPLVTTQPSGEKPSTAIPVGRSGRAARSAPGAGAPSEAVVAAPASEAQLPTQAGFGLQPASASAIA